MNQLPGRPARRILIASANPLFSRGLQKLLAERWSRIPEMRLVSSMADTLQALENWLPDLVILDYDDRSLNRAEFLNHFVAGETPMQVMLVSLQASGDVVVYDRRTLTTAQAEDWLASVDHALSRAPQPVTLTTFATPRWIAAGVLMLALIALFVRLGFWQLDRLAQRKAHNAAVSAQTGQPEFDLNRGVQDDLSAMEYRAVVVTGTYDFAGEMVLRNQVWSNQLGAQILTPLKIDGSDKTILVNRGWVPFDKAVLPQREQFAEAGRVTVRGILRNPTPRPRYVAAEPTLAPGQTYRTDWNTLNLAAMQQQSGAAMLPVYILQAPGEQPDKMPFRQIPELALDEGPHLGYAMQWFFFALVVLVGFPVFALRQARDKRGAAQSRLAEQDE